MIQAVADDVIVEPIYQQKIGLIIIPDTASNQNRMRHGIVVSIGPESSLRRRMKVGDKILWQDGEGRDIEAEGKKLMVVHAKWISAIMEDT